MDELSKDLQAVTKPKFPTSRRARTGSVKSQKAQMLVEAAACAYVLMENGEWKPGEGDVRRQFDTEGNPKPNKRELMRIAGYSRGSWDKFEEFLATQDEFWKLVELYRVRRSDPMFSSNKEKDIWLEIGNKALENIYEMVTYYPHSLTLDQNIKVVNTVVSAIGTLGKVDSKNTSKTANLLKSLPEDKRKKVLTDYKKNLEKEMEEVSSLESVYEVVDNEENL